MSLVGSTTSTSLNTTTLTGTRTGVGAGSLLVLTVSWTNLTTNTITAPAGWLTAENPAGQSNGVTRGAAAIFYKEGAAAGSHSFSITLDASSAGDAVISEWVGYGSGSLDVHTNSGATTGTSGNTGTTGAAKANDLVVVAVSVNTGTGPAADGLSSPASSGYLSLGVWTNESTNCGGEHSYKEGVGAGTQIGSWTWTSNSSYVGAIATFQPQAPGLLRPLRTRFKPIPRGYYVADTTLQVSATPGAYTWAGTTAATTQLINAGIGSWSWAGTTAGTTQLVNAGVGAWSWTGTTATTTQLVSAGVGAWSWAGATATTSQLIAATPGTWTWAGTTAETFVPVNASLGAWGWAGTTAQTAQLINASPGAWSWAGLDASVEGAISTAAAVGGDGKPKRRYQIKIDEQVYEGSKEAIEQIARELAIRAAQEAQEAVPAVAEVVVPSKKRKPAITAATQNASDVQAAYRKALEQERMRLQDQDDEEALIALLT